jgi:hypothetical protein
MPWGRRVRLLAHTFRDLSKNTKFEPVTEVDERMEQS